MSARPSASVGAVDVVESVEVVEAVEVVETTWVVGEVDVDGGSNLVLAVETAGRGAVVVAPSTDGEVSPFEPLHAVNKTAITTRTAPDFTALTSSYGTRAHLEDNVEEAVCGEHNLSRVRPHWRVRFCVGRRADGAKDRP